MWSYATYSQTVQWVDKMSVDDVLINYYTVLLITQQCNKRNFYGHSTPIYQFLTIFIFIALSMNRTIFTVIPSLMRSYILSVIKRHTPYNNHKTMVTEFHHPPRHVSSYNPSPIAIKRRRSNILMCLHHI